jgi:hypothetical protein
MKVEDELGFDGGGKIQVKFFEAINDRIDDFYSGFICRFICGDLLSARSAAKVRAETLKCCATGSAKTSGLPKAAVAIRAC